MIEKAVQFGSFHTLIGVISEPDLPGDNQHPVVILINAGLIHRVGPNRVYVKLARKLANQGLIVFRFDLSGVGDSLPRPDHMPAEQFTIDDVVQAMDFLNSTYARDRFVLIGHCAGAYHSIRTAAQDPRVTGVVMINPDGGEADWVDYDRKRQLARYYENYYIKTTMADPQRWKRFFNGQVSYRNVVKNVLQNVIWSRMSGIIFRLKRRFSTPPPSTPDEKLYSIEAIINKLSDLNIHMMLIYSENSTGFERFESIPKKNISRLKTSGKLVLSVIPGADHLFSPLTTQDQLLATIQHWLQDHLSE